MNTLRIIKCNCNGFSFFDAIFGIDQIGNLVAFNTTCWPVAAFVVAAGGSGWRRRCWCCSQLCGGRCS